MRMARSSGGDGKVDWFMVSCVETSEARHLADVSVFLKGESARCGRRWRAWKIVLVLLLLLVLEKAGDFEDEDE